MRDLKERSCGVLLHITALPGGEGIGDIGASAYRFVDWLERAGQSWWQVLPCTPTGFGESPYQSPSAYAGNPLLISLRELVDWQLLTHTEIDAVFEPMGLADPSYVAALDKSTAEILEVADTVNFDRVRDEKLRLLSRACERFEMHATDAVRVEFRRYCDAPEQFWLHDYARFSILKDRYLGAAWQTWPESLVQRDEAALDQLDNCEVLALKNVKLQQFIFSMQWRKLRAYARQHGVGLIGDCPIYVATDSADVWSRPELFDLHANGQPRVVAGVPPDYFSATGQLWGNPLYLWDEMRADGFSWWSSRVRHCSRFFDVTRIDHFRGFEAYWEVPGDALDASTGAWRSGPGADLLEALEAEGVQLIAEDLGDLTDSVHELRRAFDLPGMRVLQFGFDGGEDNPHVPERIGSDVVCYVGTHDNNTTLGWYDDLDAGRQSQVCDQLCVASRGELVTALIELALSRNAPLCILTMQDLLGLDASARFNTPGTVGGNWSWRMPATATTGHTGDKLADWLFQCTQDAGRVSGQTRTNLPVADLETAL